MGGLPPVSTPRIKPRAGEAGASSPLPPKLGMRRFRDWVRRDGEDPIPQSFRIPKRQKGGSPKMDPEDKMRR